MKRIVAGCVLVAAMGAAGVETENVTVFKEPGRYGGWPANHGIWGWGDEIVVGFTAAWYKPATNDHAIDRAKASEVWQARSLDGGRTWSVEKPPSLAKESRASDLPPLPGPLDFTAPDQALMFRFGSLHVGPSWLYVSDDRCRTWRGPYAFRAEGIDKVAARTDVVVLGAREALMFASAAKENDKEGRAFCARTEDGGLTWKLAGLIGPVPEGFAIMPSSARLADGSLLTTIRHVDKGRPATIDAYRSADGGATWEFLGAAAHDNGGNPPSLVTLKDGRLCVTYGCRRKPFGIRARISADGGRSWGPEILLRADGLTGDLGYPRSLVRPDGRVVTVYYFNGPRDEDRAIEATIWTP